MRRALVALAAACACLAAPATGSAAPPTNDTPAGAHHLTPGNLRGVRHVPYFTGTDVTTQAINTTEATSSPDDPVLQPEERSTCNEFPTTGAATVFYVMQFSERTAVTLDTLGTSYPTVVGVFRGSVAQSTLLTCARGNLVAGQSLVDWVAQANEVYFIEVASAAAGGGSLTLNMRATDVQPPTFSITARGALAQPGGKTVFIMSDPVDNGSGIDTTRPFTWSVTFRPDGGKERPLAFTVVPERENTEIEVGWPKNPQFARGIVSVEVWDVAGNRGTNQLNLPIRDRKPPSVFRRPVVRPDHRRNRISATLRCSEPGTGTIQLQGPRRRTVTIKKMKAKAPRTVMWKNLPPGGYLLVFRCRDNAGNFSAQKVSDPFLLR